MKQTKQEVFFERVLKEINLYQQKIVKTEVGELAKIKVLKSKIETCDKTLSDAFDKLSPKEILENEDSYLKYKDILCELTIELESKSQNLQPEQNGEPKVDCNSVIKLPKFEIPYFYGNSETWISFKTIFKSSILENSKLNDIEKLQYLQASVRGDAAKLIRGFNIEPQNLKNCWDILSDRFENKRQLAISQINKIFSMKLIKASNSKALLEIVDTCNEALRNLDSLGLHSSELSDLILINFLISKVDDNIKQRWELSLENDKIPDLDTFKKFVERESRSLNTNETKGYKTEVRKMHNRQIENNVTKSHVNSVLVKGGDCLSCKEVHALYKCPKFNSLSINERWKLVNEHKLCSNCLRNNHQVETCRIQINCKNCSKRHHTLLHRYTVNENRNNPVMTVSNNLLQSNQSCNVLLSTASIQVRSKSGRLIKCRALIDNASQNSLITTKCANKLKLPLRNTNFRLVGINETSAETSLFLTSFEFSAHFPSVFQQVDALVVSKVTTPLPNFTLKTTNWPHIHGLILADPSFATSQEIDILLGADVASSIVTGAPIIGQNNTPVALPTKLGHLLSGKVDIPQSQRSIVCHTLINIENTLKDFWQIEAIPKPLKSSDEDEQCEDIFIKNYKRTPEGRYILKLPFRESCVLGESKEGALRKFYSLERKLQSDEQLRKSYISFMDEYATLGHMTPLSNESDESRNFFLPHHGVINENSSTTRLRVVFDASFKTTNGKSLNDTLLIGKKLQTDIFATLLKFRTFPVALSADIAKMYRQILICEEDRAFQQILWRKSPTDPLLVYQLNTVTYGTACAPFLAIRTLHQLCADEKHKFPNAAKLAQSHFYVDDLLSGANSVEAAKVMVQDLIKFMATGGFELRKWCCSHSEVLENLPEDLKPSNLSSSLLHENSQKILGLFWNLTVDSFVVRTVTTHNVLTKRHVLSIIAKTFDPLGLISPSTIILKILLQDIWKANLDWDDQLPQEIIEKWQRFQSESEYFKTIQIPRYFQSLGAIKCDIHGFCDASSKAYAAVVYIRVVKDTPRVSLMASKTRVAPVQQLTLPRLELCGALLLADLITTIKNAVNIPIHSTHLWCDSTITLSWIINPPTKGNQFVQHRVSKINTLTSPQSWHHIPGKSNPADCATRGLFPKQLLEHSEWINGPKWLYEPEESFLPPTNDNPSDTPNICDSESTIERACLVTQLNNCEFFAKFSSYIKLLRTVAWIYRFYKNTKSTSKTSGPLKSIEIETATQVIVKLLQQTEFKTEIDLIRKNKPLPKSSKLIALNASLDSNGILRVGGRLRNQQTFDLDQKYPMLIPKNSHFTTLLIRHFHKVNFHAGQELTLSLIRQRLWIPDGKSAVRKVLRNCIECFKSAAKPISQIMGNLPQERVNPCRAFLKVGVDFAGPFDTKCEHSRKANIFKSYLCLFVCMCTKAVHLELVSTLSAAAFLAALRRFVSRRGYPSDIFSDNGRNFVGASAYLKSLFNLPKDPSVQNYSSTLNITWHYIPPYAPNFGGIWEASIKLAKTHLLKTCRSALLNYEELSTLFCQIEACINSRPLYPLSPDTKDFQVLTPGHFLIGCPLLEIPETSHTNASLSCHSRWSLLLQLKEKFWQRWRTSYLHHLQPRGKWKQGLTDIKPGALAIIKDPSSVSTTWSLGRITALHPGADGVVRVVDLDTTKGPTARLVSQIAILPLQEANSSPPAEYVGKKQEH